MASNPPPLPPQSCAACGAQIASGLLRCPGCGRLVHAATLSRLADEAATAERDGDPRAALERWREALQLVPRDAPQHEQISKRVDALVGQAQRQPMKRDGAKGRWAGVAGVGSVLMLALSKLKFVGLAFTKWPALLSMLAFFGIYWAAFGWIFAAGIVVSLYIHELGHAFEMRRRGMPVVGIMFVPGIGAYTRGAQPAASDVEANRIGLAGPIWGLGAALAALAAWKLTGQPHWAAIARMGAWLNLANLLPVWQLDGSRAFASLARWQRAVAAIACVGSFALTHDLLPIVIAVAAGFRVVSGRAPERADHLGLVNFVGLVAALSALLFLHVPGVPS